MNNRKLSLFTGLTLLLVAACLYWTGQPSSVYLCVFGAAIVFKSLFLYQTLRAPGFKMSIAMYMILAGIALILASLLFKNIYPQPVIRNILFYTAIALKVSGVSWLLYRQKRK